MRSATPQGRADQRPIIAGVKQPAEAVQRVAVDAPPLEGLQAADATASPTHRPVPHADGVPPAKLMPPEPTALDGPIVSVVQSWLQAPFVAIQFLSVLPPLVRRPLGPSDLGRSESFFPLAGLLLGALLAGTELLLRPVVAQPVRDVLLVALLAALTGALHLDGVIDTFDGIFAHGGPARRLEIMRDPRAGAFGVVGLVLLLALKLAALGSLPPDARLPALLLAPALGRWAIVLVTRQFPYARPEGMGRSFKDAVRWSHVALAGTMAAGLAWAVSGPSGLMVAASVSVLALLLARWLAGRLGGLSGDTYGAICELTEAGVLVALGLQIGGVG